LRYYKQSQNIFEMKLPITFFAILFTQFIFSQTPINEAVTKENNINKVVSDNTIIKGTTLEEISGKSLPGVNVKIKDTKLYTISDSEGNFIFRTVPVGKYEIEFSATGFETKTVTDVETNVTEATNLTVSLIEKKNKLNEVVIQQKVKAKAESLASLLTAQKSSSKVQDGISAESIKRTPDKTTSDVLKRISGASIQDNKFVIIRGLNDRYNTSFLNGAPLPSSEPDRKAFSFDIFPANMIDNLVIYKTASPDLPGEFAGGVIEINTKATPDKNFQSLTIGSGYNEITTGKQQIYANGGKTDWLGVDDGTRALPSYFPDVKTFKQLQSQNQVSQIADLAKKYQTDWKLNEKTFSPNTNFQFTLGRFLKGKDESSFGILFSLSHSKTNNFNEVNRKNYETPQTPDKDFLDKRFSEQILFGGLLNMSFKLNANNSFSFKNLYSINSDNRIFDRSGITNINDNVRVQTTRRLFTSNSIYSGQLSGEHFLSVSRIKINWVSSFSMVERTTPNDRSNTYSIRPDSNGDLLPPTASFSINTIGFDAPGFLFSAKNTETIHNGKLDISKKIKISDDFNSEIKVGYFNQSRNRTFVARQLGYIPFNGRVDGSNYNSSTFDGTIGLQPNETIFNSSNIGILGFRRSGLTLFDGTRDNDSYTATSDLNAGFAMFDSSYKKLRLVFGARLESYSQKLNAKTDAGLPIVVDNSKNDILPSVNFIYGINKKQNLRLSFSKTLNRPEFRELAPFIFFDTSTDFTTEGNPDLKICEIKNYDLRYEIFPGKGQLFSFSLFYKKFDNPIELQALANNSNKYNNALAASNKGFELEYRTLLGSIVGSENKLLNDLTLYTNLAIIRSKVDISNLVKSNDFIEVPLQGQSPYVFNAGLQYINKELGWSTSLNINRIGNRIAIQGNQTPGATTPAFWEKSRTFLDGQITKSFMKNKLELKFNIQNILKQDQIFYQNNNLDKTEVTGFEAKINEFFTGDSQNKNGYNENEDDLISLTKFGRTFSFSMTYNF
jgi:Outer membrane protein beta-barrel family/CarboxypepD_reg-like domain/TonB-dependent Receptor Plug Domain